MEYVEEPQALSFDKQQQGERRERSADVKLNKTCKPSRVQKRAGAEKKCSSCSTTSTPVWRWGGESKEVLLCNACSLRIRRSANRPQRSKSPSSSPPQKVSPSSTSQEGTPLPDSVLAELPPNEAEALRLQLLRCVEWHLSIEKARLLGPRELISNEEDWYAWQQLGAAEREWQLNHQIQQQQHHQHQQYMHRQLQQQHPHMHQQQHHHQHSGMPDNGLSRLDFSGQGVLPSGPNDGGLLRMF